MGVTYFLPSMFNTPVSFIISSSLRSYWSCKGWGGKAPANLSRSRESGGPLRWWAVAAPAVTRRVRGEVRPKEFESRARPREGRGREDREPPGVEGGLNEDSSVGGEF